MGSLSQFISHALQQCTCELPCPRRTKPDRGRHAIATLCDTVMPPTRRKVEHVAWLQHPLRLRIEFGQYPKGKARHQGVVTGRSNPPTSAALNLQQEHVIGIHVWPHATPVTGVRQHEVVDPSLWNEIESAQHFMRGVQVQVQPLHQQGPTRTLAWRKAAPTHRAVPQTPLVAALLDAARLHLVALDEVKELPTVGGRLNTRPSLPNQQRLALPMPPHEQRRRQTAQQGTGGVKGVDGGGG